MAVRQEKQYCTNCSAILKENVKFCPECGMKVEDHDATIVTGQEEKVLEVEQKKSEQERESKGIKLKSITPFENSMSPLDKGYYICGAIGFIIGLKGGINGAVFLGLLGLFLWWIIKANIALYKWRRLKTYKFYQERQISQSVLFPELIKAITPYGLRVDERSDGTLEVPYKNVKLQIVCNSDGTFSMPWKQNAGLLFFDCRYITSYKNTVAAMSILGYNYQRICSTEAENDCSACENYGNETETVKAKGFLQDFLQKNKWKRKKSLLIGGGILLAALVAVILFGGGELFSSTERTPDKDFPFVSDVTVASTTFEFKVDRAWATDTIKCPEEQQEYFESKYLHPVDDNAVFLIVEYTFTNISGQSLTERPIIRLIDSEGVAYGRDEDITMFVRQGGTSPDYSVYDEGVQLDQPMGPGLSIKGQCTFIIAKDRLNNNSLITCSRPLTNENNIVELLTGVDLGTAEEVGISLDGMEGDAIARRKEEKMAEETQKRRDMLTTSDKYYKVLEDTVLYDYVGGDGDDGIYCTIPANHYVEYNQYSMKDSIYEKAGFMFVSYYGYTEENPYASVEYEGYIDKGALISNKGDTFAHASEEKVIQYFDELDNEETSSTPDDIPVDMTVQQEDDVTNYENDYILPYSNTQFISNMGSHVLTMTSEYLRLAKNEIYARHGRRFNDSELQAYFDAQSWYKGTIEPEAFDENVLNVFEKSNIEILNSMLEN